jgi:hypothetical protein
MERNIIFVIKNYSMELKSTLSFEALFNKLLKIVQPLESDYNYIVERESNTNKIYLLYTRTFLDDLSNIHNFTTDLRKSIFNIENLSGNDDEKRARFIIRELEDGLIDFHIKVKTFWDMIIRFVAMVNKLHIKNRYHYYEELKEKISSNNVITEYLEEINKIVSTFDNGRRNKIIHEGAFSDEEIKNAEIDAMIGWITKKINPEYSLQKRVNELVENKLTIVDKVCEDILKQLLPLFDLLEEKYYRIANEL